MICDYVPLLGVVNSLLPANCSLGNIQIPTCVNDNENSVFFVGPYLAGSSKYELKQMPDASFWKLSFDHLVEDVSGRN